MKKKKPKRAKFKPDKDAPKPHDGPITFPPLFGKMPPTFQALVQERVNRITDLCCQRFSEIGVDMETLRDETMVNAVRSLMNGDVVMSKNRGDIVRSWGFSPGVLWKDVLKELKIKR